MDINMSHLDSLERFKGQSIALLGGSFDPFHNAHRMLVKSAVEALPVEALLVMPLGWAPHKTTRMRLAAFRYEMSIRGVYGIPRVYVSDEEIKTPAISYTIDTVTHLINKISPDPLYLVIGSDSFEALPSWRCYKELALKVVFAVARRGDDDMEKLHTLAERYQKEDDAHVVFFKMPPSSLSSSNLRTALRQGKSVEGACPEKVVGLINTYRIYDFQDEYDALSEESWSRIRSTEQAAWRYYTQKQRLHVVSVAQYAARLALANGVDLEKAFIAGLLHDAAKNLPVKERLLLAEAYLTSHLFAKDAAKVIRDVAFSNKNKLVSSDQSVKEFGSYYEGSDYHSVLLNTSLSEMRTTCLSDNSSSEIQTSCLSDNSSSEMRASYLSDSSSSEIQTTCLSDSSSSEMRTSYLSNASSSKIRNSCLNDNETLWLTSLNKSLLHGPAGAMLAKNIFGIYEPDILDAICFHSTARPNMTSFEKVLYLADKIAYDRTFKRLEPIRKYSQKGDLDFAMHLCLEETFVALNRKGKIPHPFSIAAYEEIRDL